MIGFISFLFMTQVNAFQLSNQFGETRDFSQLQEEEAVLFASDMKGYKLLKASLAELPKPKNQLEEKKLTVVADISGMPRLISQMVAIPRMKELPYPIFLDHEGKVVKDWPHKQGTLFLMKRQSDGKWQEIKQFETAQSLKQFLNHDSPPTP